jgi:hypothetical protein
MYQIYDKETIKKMKERGIYTSPKESSFKSDREVKRKMALRGELPEFVTPLPAKRDWKYWSARFIQKEKDFKEAIPKKENNIIIRLPMPALVSFIGDLHAGNPHTFHERVALEIESILNTKNSFLILGGDMIDGFFFNPAQYEQIEQLPEQRRYLTSMIEELGKNHKLLVAWSGEHDTWGKKMGADPYTSFAESVNAYFIEGIGYVTLNVGKQNVKILVSHKLPGSSIYNYAHPATRASREIQGADIYIGFHTHKKAHLEQSVKLFGGEAKWVHLCAAGTYKTDDEYSRRNGWANQDPKEMFGFSFEFNGEDIVYHNDILKAHKNFSG